MRIRPVLVTTMLVLAPAVARAQDTPPAPTPATTAWVDFGIRGTTSTGDAARYERYRDLGNGLFIQNFRVSHQQSGWITKASGANVGRLDQRLQASLAKPGKFKAYAMWDQIPMLMSRTTQSIFQQDLSTTPNVLTIDNAIQTQVQANVNALPGLLAANAHPFDLKSHRYIGQAGFDYLATQDLTVKTQAQYTERVGEIPYGMSFGQSSLVEFPAPIKHQLSDVDSQAEYAHDIWLFRGGFNGSWFHNSNTTATVDNPFRVTDSASVPSRGELSLPPSNSFVGVNGTASVKLPGHSRATAYVSTGMLKDAGAPIMAQSINTAFTTAPLDRATVEGEARTTSLNLSFVSRPTRNSDVNVRYRTYQYDNRTPEFLMTQRVSYDNTPAPATFTSLGGVTSPVGIDTEPFSIVRRTFDADFRVRPMFGSAASIGFSRNVEDRSLRVIDATTENVARATFDVLSTRWLSVRTKYEYSQRRGNATDEALRELFMIGEQPLIGQYDVANRNRNRVTVVSSVTATSSLSFNGSIAAGKDDYLESVFGLRDNTHRIYAAGFDYAPSDLLTFSASYSYERYNALSRSRQENPPAAGATFSYNTFLALSQLTSGLTANQQVADAARNWATDGTDRVHSVILRAEVNQIASKLDLAFSYDYNHSGSIYNYITGPVVDRTLPEEVVVDTTLPAPTQLPPNKSELQRGTMDAVYTVSRRVGLGLTYWYEQYRVTDFTLDGQSNPTGLARGSALLLGYLYLPYTASTVFGRVIVKW